MGESKPICLSNFQPDCPERFDKCFRIVDRSLELSDSLKAALEGLELEDTRLSYYQIALFASQSKCEQCLLAIAVLCNRGLVEDARTIARKVIEIWVAIEYISRSPVRRAERYIFHDGIRKYFLSKRILEDDSYPPVLREKLEVYFPKYEEHFDKYRHKFPHSPKDKFDPKYRFKWSGKSFNQMAISCGLHELRMPYNLYSSSTHSGPDDVNRNYSESKTTFGPKVDKEEIPRIIYLAVRGLSVVLSRIVMEFGL